MSQPETSIVESTCLKTKQWSVKSLYRVVVYNCIAAVSLAYHSWWGEGEVGSVAQMARDQKNLILKKTK